MIDDKSEQIYDVWREMMKEGWKGFNGISNKKKRKLRLFNIYQNDIWAEWSVEHSNKRIKNILWFLLLLILKSTVSVIDVIFYSIKAVLISIKISFSFL